LPSADEKIGYHPANIFVPKNTPQPKKIDNEKPEIPKMIRSSDAGESEVWFKQDDQFD